MSRLPSHSLAAATALFLGGVASPQSLLRDLNTTAVPNVGSDLHAVLTVGSATYLGITTPSLRQLWTTDGSASGTQLFCEFDTTGAPGPVANFCDVNGVLFFSTPTRLYAEALWRTDGTEAGTRMVKDIRIGGTGASLPGNLRPLNGLLVFSAPRGISNARLWRSDGTGLGTYPLTAGILSSVERVVGGVCLFVATDPQTGTEVWSTDGSAAGTGLLKDCLPGPGNGAPADFAALGSAVIFTAADTATTRATWITDGTAAGTRPIRDVHPGYEGVYPTSFALLNNQRIFLKQNAQGGTELWQGDGTVAGTSLIKILDPTARVSFENIIYSLGSRAVFEGIRGPRDDEIWITDGTAQGTQSVDLKPGGGGSEPQGFFLAHGAVYFTADDSVVGRELYRSDGTLQGSGLVKDVRPGSEGASIRGFFATQGMVLFTADDGVHGAELWTTDGTPAGTVLLKDIHAGGASDPEGAHLANGTPLFTADDGVHGRELWTTDGTTAGTRLLKDLNGAVVSAAANPFNLVEFQGDLLVSTFFPGPALWRSDGTSAGTTQLAAGLPGNNADKLVVNGQYYSLTSAGSVFVSDGTPPGTRVITDAQNAPLTRMAYLLGTLANAVILFNNVSDPIQVGLWRTDGTEAGTVAIMAGLEPMDRQSATVNRRWAVLNGVGYFRARDRNGQEGFELWRTDGTAAGTSLVSDIYPGPGSSAPAVMCLLNNRLVFHADHPTYGRELWRSDGTAAGTALVIDLNPGTAPGAGALWQESALQGGALMLFPGDDGSHGLELFRTDGTAAGTTLVRDIVTGPGTPFADQARTVARWVRAGEQIYFAADDGQLGTEIWSSDGTAAGTRIVRDLYPDQTGSLPSMLTPLDSTGLLLFAATSPGLGSELWRTDGTAVGTQLVADLNPGPRNSTFRESLRVGSTAYFVVDDGQYGAEVWKLSLAQLNGTLLERFGDGCRGAQVEAPQLAGVGLPRLGETGFAVALDRAAGGAFTALQLGASMHRGWLGGCVWWPTLPVATLAAVTDRSGAVRWALPVPFDPHLSGLELFGQSAVLPPGQGWSGLSCTNGLHVMVGR